MTHFFDTLMDRLAHISVASSTFCHKKVKVCQPHPFDEKDEDKLRTFFLQLELYFYAASAKFTCRSAKVNFALIYLKKMPLNLVELLISNLDITLSG